MKIRALIMASVLALAAMVPLNAAAVQETENWFAMPMAEVKEVVTDWLHQHDYQIYQVSSAYQRLELVAEKPGSHLALTLIPQSPLATRVVFDQDQSSNRQQAEALKQHLLGYIGIPGGGASRLPPQFMVPERVRGQLGVVVCIYSNIGNQDIQLSGFIIDTQGWVVCTAHDLKAKQPVTVLLSNGREINGRVDKLDTMRDLALIHTQIALPESVSLRNGRYLLRNGDEIYALTCPNSGDTGIAPGVLDGPPRRVNGLPLWQAQVHIDHGSSGSPVFDHHGRLAAVVKGRYRGTDSIGFLIPFETLLHFLEKY